MKLPHGDPVDPHPLLPRQRGWNFLIRNVRFHPFLLSCVWEWGQPGADMVSAGGRGPHGRRKDPQDTRMPP